jgi:hypothetical protein
MLSNKSWMVEDMLTAYNTLFNMLRWNIYQLHRVSKFQVVMYIFYLTVSCITMQSHQSNQTRSTTLRSFIGVNIPLVCFINVMTYNTCIHVCIICVAYEQFTQNIKIPWQNKITFYNFNQTYK